jgi:hypothetical protein
MIFNFKKAIFLKIFLFLASEAFAPVSNRLIIFHSQPVRPFEQLIEAIGMVETSLDTLAYNKQEGAVGFFQIRQIRLEDYNNRTGNDYTLNDMFDYEISEEVFLYYASRIGPYDLEKIAKRWNGSGPGTIQYWRRVRRYL